jgi:HK97 family phage prohead protease
MSTASQQQIRTAAAARRDGLAQRTDRPQQRRSDHASGSPARTGARIRGLSLRDSADGTTVAFHGIASAYETPYEMYDFWGPYTEVVSAGAGSASLARADLDVPLVLQHRDLRRIARTTSPDSPLSLTETYEGLDVTAPRLSLADADVAYIVPKLRAGLVDEMSFKFMIEAGVWSPDYMEYRITRYDIHRGDVAIVGYGANPATYAELRAGGALDLTRLTPADLRALRQRVDERLSIIISDLDLSGQACPDCGAINDGDATYCDQCAASMIPAANAAGGGVNRSVAQAQAILDLYPG